MTKVQVLVTVTHKMNKCEQKSTLNVSHIQCCMRQWFSVIKSMWQFLQNIIIAFSTVRVPYTYVNTNSAIHTNVHRLRTLVYGGILVFLNTWSKVWAAYRRDVLMRVVALLPPRTVPLTSDTYDDISNNTTAWFLLAACSFSWNCASSYFTTLILKRLKFFLKTLKSCSC